MIEKLALSPHCSARGGAKISAVVMHTTGSDNCKGTLDWFARTDIERESMVSSHVVIDLDGTVYRCVPDDQVAWHAGKSILHHQAGINSISLGVELVGKKPTSYPTAQLQAAAHWVGEKCYQYGIPMNRVVSHADIAIPPGRKTDPENFPWVLFFQMVAKHFHEPS